MNWFVEEGFREVHYINAWPYCPPEERFRIPGFADSFRIGQLLGVIGKKKRSVQVRLNELARAA